MLSPKFQDQKAAFDTQFSGMTSDTFSYEDFENARERLVKEIHQSLTDNDKELLISFKQGEPKWELYSLVVLKDMPSVQWKLQNVRKLLKNSKKHAEQLDRLKKCLGVSE